MKKSNPDRVDILAVSAFVLITASACGRGDPASEQPQGNAVATKSAIAVEVARNLDVPWALAFAPDGRIFLTERPGRIRVIENGALLREPWATLPVRSDGETGLMGIALAPDFQTSGFVYVVGTFGTGEDLVNRVVRFTEKHGRGVEPVTLVDNLPASRFHAGDAVAFGPDGMLYVATGDAQNPGNAQKKESLAGKILRYRPDGEIPSDNVDPRSPIYALGLRNPQGLAWHNETGQLFATDHGPSGFPNERLRRNRDELNAIVAGGNYGWPTVSGNDSDRRFVPPLVEWTPAIAPSGLAIYTGAHSPWSGSALVGALRGKHLRRVVLERTATGWRVSGEETLFPDSLGRIRAVAMGPDGYIYFTTSNQDGRGDLFAGDDKLFRIATP